MSRGSDCRAGRAAVRSARVRRASIDGAGRRAALRGQVLLALVVALSLTALLSGCSADREPALGEESVQPGEAAIAREMIRLIEEVSLARSAGGKPVRRFNQVKSLACLDATFTVPDGLPAKLAQGMFAMPGSYPAVLRFANASTLDDREKDLRGVSIKIPEFRDAQLTRGEARELDFLFNSYPALFVGTPEDFLGFVSATAAGRRWLFFLTHPGALLAILRARGNPASPFDIRYWSTTPYRLGDDASSAVKYSLKPCSAISTTAPEDPDADYLVRAMAEHLQKEPACFEFMVQFQSDAAEMPIEDASAIWDEEISPFNAVARIVIEDQVFRDEPHAAACEDLRFNPWNALDAHRPLGGINRVRKQVYDEVGSFRVRENARRR